MEKNKKYYLIYKITNLLNNKIYVGAHSTNNLSDKYMGSSKHLRKDIKLFGKENFLKETLFIFDNKLDMMRKESEIVDKNFCFREDTYNVMVGGISGSFNFLGMTTVKDSNGNLMKVYTDDPRYLSGELMSHSKGTVPVVDNDGNNFRVSIDDPRYLSGELSFNCKNRVPVIDISGNTFSVDKNDSRYLSGELKYIQKGKVLVIDKCGNKFSVDINDPRYLSGELVHNLKDTIVVKDNNGNRLCVKKDDQRYLSGELVGWAKGRPGIKGMLGKKVTDEVKENLRQKAKLRTGEKSSAFGKKNINNGKINKKIKSEDLDKYISEGWMLGMIPKRTKEDVIASAQKFNNKKDFRIHDSKNYSYAEKRGWLEECYKHMKK